MSSKRQIWGLIKQFKLIYLAVFGVLLIRFLMHPEYTRGLLGKVVFDILQGVESVEFFSGSISFDVGKDLQERIATVFWITGGFVGLFIISAIPLFVSSFLYTRMRYSTTALLQKNMLSSIYRRPGAESLTGSTGDAISRFRGDTEQAPMFFSMLQGLGSHLVIGCFALILLMSVDAMVTSIVFFPLLFVVIVAQIASERVQKYREASRESTGDVTGVIGEVFGAVQAVQVATAEAHLINHFRQFNERRRKAGLQDLLFNNVLGAVFNGAAAIGMGVVLLLVGHKLRSGEMTAGDFALYQFYLGTVLSIPLILGSFIIGYRQLNVSMQRMQDVMGDEPADRLVESSPTYLSGDYPPIPVIKKDESHRLKTLSVSGLCNKFSNGNTGVKNINLEINRGEFVAITGRVGSGKTTLLRSILGLLPLDKGEIHWNGELVTSPETFFIPPRSAYVSQTPKLYSDSLRDNILLGLPEDQFDVDQALKFAVLDDIEELLEDGLDTKIGPRGVRLSGGQIQRVAAARMFIREPELLVIDDLSSALDVITEEKLWSRMSDREGMTCLVVTHRPSVLKNADKVIVLKNGTIDYVGTFEEVLKNSEEMRQFWSDT